MAMAWQAWGPGPEHNQKLIDGVRKEAPGVPPVNPGPQEAPAEWQEVDPATLVGPDVDPLAVMDVPASAQPSAVTAKTRVPPSSVKPISADTVPEPAPAEHEEVNPDA